MYTEKKTLYGLFINVSPHVTVSLADSAWDELRRKKVQLFTNVTWFPRTALGINNEHVL